LASRAGALHRFVDQLLGDDVQLDVLALADPDEPVEPILCSPARPTAHDADGPVDHRAAAQRTL
jgi:hypothetical protein